MSDQETETARLRAAALQDVQRILDLSARVHELEGVREQERAARIRLEHALVLLDGHLAAIRSHIANDLPTTGVRQNLIGSAVAVNEHLAIIDAFRYDRKG